MVTYQDLKAKKSRSTCIYDAFSHITTDSKESMGLTVNNKGVDADDTRAVTILADKYRLTVVEAINGLDYEKEYSGLDAGKKFIVVATKDSKIVSVIKPLVNDQTNLTLYLGSARAKEVFEKMVTHQSFFVPVTKDGKLYGILTYAELMKKAQEMQEE